MNDPAIISHPLRLKGIFTFLNTLLDTYSTPVNYMLRAYKISLGASDVLTERLNTRACCGYYTTLNIISHIIQNAESI